MFVIKSKLKSVLIFLCLLQYASGDNLWINQFSNTSTILNKVYFTDSINGWAAGDSGIILHTTNGGNLWIFQTSNTLNNITDLRFLNVNTGWAIAFKPVSFNNSVLLKTTNSGLNWIIFPFADTNLLLYTFNFLDNYTGWVGGYLGTILKTSNGGSSWIQQMDTSQYSYNSVNRIKFYNERIGFACGGFMDLAGVMWKFSYSGNIWGGQGIAGEPLFDFTFLDSNTIIGVGGDFEYGLIIVKTTNSGLNWDYNPIYYFGVGKAISFRTNTEAWVPLSYSNTFAVTTNSGDNWYVVPTPDSATLEDIQFVDENHGWTCGLNGAIYKYNSSLIGISNNSNAVSSYFNLYQNYPNPFNPVTTIKYYLSKPSFVRLTIYDVSVKEVKNIFDSYKSAGEHKIKFDSDGFASGVYLYSIETNFGMMTKKMVILK